MFKYYLISPKVMLKKGQLTIFIILGILIFVLFFFLLLWFNSLNKEKLKVEQEQIESQIIIYTRAKFLIQSCFKKISTESIFMISQQGGYYLVPSRIAIKYFSFDIPLYFPKELGEVPSLSIIQDGLSNYIIDRIDTDCLYKLNSLEDQGISVILGNLSATTTIVPNKILFQLKYPVSISKDNQSAQLENFAVTLNIDFYSFYQELEKTFKIIKEFPEEMPLGTLTNLASQGKYQLEIDNLKNDLILYTFLFDPGYNYETPLVFNYGVKYPWGDGLS